MLCVKKFRIDNSKRERHSAIIDCELLSKVYINLIGEKEPKLDLLNKNEKKSSKTVDEKIKYSKKIIYPTHEELKLHKQFLKTEFKKNFFN